MIPVLSGLGYRLAQFLTQTDEERESVATCSREALEKALQPGDVLLIDGSSRISMAIKYITQSTWSHAAIFIGKDNLLDVETSNQHVLIEADVKEGVRKVPLSNYCQNHTRICRPVGLSADEVQQVIGFMKDRIGYKYDLKNIFDLARYFIQTPPVPQKYRRRLLALGSGDPTKAICSSLIAQAFQLVRYPILPNIDIDESSSKAAIQSHKEMFHIRHDSLFAPRDFDVSPYFQIVKPSIRDGFDHHQLQWAERENE
ncbi:MAG: YiiX/YebB-like N1pC/P60 family cysteine hydrolase [Bacteroidota bacterium]